MHPAFTRFRPHSELFPSAAPPSRCAASGRFVWLDSRAVCVCCVCARGVRYARRRLSRAIFSCFVNLRSRRIGRRWPQQRSPRRATRAARLPRTVPAPRASRRHRLDRTASGRKHALGRPRCSLLALAARARRCTAAAAALESPRLVAASPRRRVVAASSPAAAALALRRIAPSPRRSVVACIRVVASSRRLVASSPRLVALPRLLARTQGPRGHVCAGPHRAVMSTRQCSSVQACACACAVGERARQRRAARRSRAEAAPRPHHARTRRTPRSCICMPAGARDRARVLYAPFHPFFRHPRSRRAGCSLDCERRARPDLHLRQQRRRVRSVHHAHARGRAGGTRAQHAAASQACCRMRASLTQPSVHPLSALCCASTHVRQHVALAHRRAPADCEPGARRG